eukprot:jgi/Picre1/31163/NNA_006517.t1
MRPWRRCYGDCSARRGPDGGLWTGIRPNHISAASKMVMEYSGMPVQPHKAIVGANAFAHASGIHQDGMLKNPGTYEIMSPETIGLQRGAGDVGVVLANSLEEMLWEQDSKSSDMMHANSNSQIGGTRLVLRIASSVGTGPVDAAYKAIDSIVGLEVDLVDYSMASVTEGIDALANTRVVIRPCNATLSSIQLVENAQGAIRERTYTGNAASEDVVVASARAYISALNKMISVCKLEKTSIEASESSREEPVNA